MACNLRLDSSDPRPTDATLRRLADDIILSYRLGAAPGSARTGAAFGRRPDRTLAPVIALMLGGVLHSSYKNV